MSTHSLVNTIRGKKLGVLLRNARLVRQKTLEECAKAMGIDAELLQAYEMGERLPSLPEVELLSYYLGIPLEHFWNQTGLLSDSAKQSFNPRQLLGLRQRMVGVQVRKARLQAQTEVGELAKKTGISLEKLMAYESGKQPIPLPDLEVLALALDLPIREFQDNKGPVGGWFSQQRAMQSFQELSPELQAFVSKPVNRPYIELAYRLSEMDVDKLRTVAEGLLEITL